MARKSKVEQQLSQIISAVQFFPTPEQRDAKSSFWLSIQDNPIVDLGHITLAGIVQITGQQKIEKWWTQPGFREWFTNQEEFKMKLESASHQALDTLMEIMANPDAAPAARVAAAKMVIEASGKNESRKQAEMADKHIQQMSEQQLEAYLARHMKMVEAKSED